MNLTGVYFGLFMLFCIGFGFLWVIRLEYAVGARAWKAVLAIGLLICLGSLLAPTFVISAMMGVFGGSVVWGATELPAQTERVRRGLFPANPRRKDHQEYKYPPGGFEP